MPSDSSTQPTVQGYCYALFAYDASMAINLDLADRLIADAKERATFKHQRPAPSYFQYRPAPLRLTRDAQSLTLKGRDYTAHVEMVLYDFGAISVAYRIPLAGSLADLMAVSDALYDNTLLSDNSRRRVQELMVLLGDALHKPSLSDLMEDYVVFHITQIDSTFDLEAFCTEHATALAGILRAERLQLSPQEIHDALSYRMSYGLNDVLFVDWHAAFIYSREGEDLREVLEFANVELLEMRFLDQLLDDALTRSYRSLSLSRWASIAEMLSHRSNLRQVAQLQVDSALLFEGVNNALKLLGDQYLARIYRLVSQRFHLAEWDASILRKLQTIESIYEKLSDHANSRRTEILEWIIIVLIAIELVMSLLRTH